MKLIQIPTTFNNHLQNVTIEFTDHPEHYGKKVTLTLTENKNQNMNPKSWSYQHLFQTTNIHQT